MRWVGSVNFQLEWKPSSPCGLTNSPTAAQWIRHAKIESRCVLSVLSSRGLSFPFRIPMRHLSNAEYESKTKPCLCAVSSP